MNERTAALAGALDRARAVGEVVLVLDDEMSNLLEAISVGDRLGIRVHPCEFPELIFGKGGGSIDLAQEMIEDIISLLPHVDGVVTDLMAPVLKAADAPIGIIWALRAVAAGVPVAICTSIDRDGERGHHATDVNWLYMSLFKLGGTCPALLRGWEGRKSWEAAFKLVLSQPTTAQ